MGFVNQLMTRGDICNQGDGRRAGHREEGEQPSHFGLDLGTAQRVFTVESLDMMSIYCKKSGSLSQNTDGFRLVMGKLPGFNNQAWVFPRFGLVPKFAMIYEIKVASSWQPF